MTSVDAPAPMVVPSRVLGSRCLEVSASTPIIATADNPVEPQDVDADRRDGPENRARQRAQTDRQRTDG